jgi:hypothetical protein
MRMRFGISLIISVALGVATQFASGPAFEWVARGLGGAFYVLVWIFAALFVFPDWRPKRVCAGALFATILVECAQLWHPAWLDSIRATWPGGLLLGSAFHWADFPYYFLGYFIGLGWTRP